MNKIVLYCILFNYCAAHGHTQDNQCTYGHIHINGLFGKKSSFKTKLFDNKCILNTVHLPKLHNSFTFRVDNKWVNLKSEGWK